jgi:hypothetical protein
MTTIKAYSLAIIASHNVFSFLEHHVRQLSERGIRYKRLYVGDAGLSHDERRAIEAEVEGVEFLDLGVKVFDSGFKTQSEPYRKVIRNRIPFLRRVFELAEYGPVLQLDADTAIITNDFSLIDRNAHVTLTVRETEPWEHVELKREKRYPNCGVIFWHQPRSCLDFLAKWESIQESSAPHAGQYEQNHFYQAMKEEEFRRLDVQRVHCKFYNCYLPYWVNKHTAILHYKGFDPETDSFERRIGRFEMRDEYDLYSPLAKSTPFTAPQEKGSILYFCPDINIRSGGISRLYRHVRLLNAHGISAAILHERPGFVIEHEARVNTRYLQLPSVRQNDIIVAPEGYPNILRLAKAHNLRAFAIALNWHYMVEAMPATGWKDLGVECALVVAPFIRDATEWLMGVKASLISFSIDPNLYYDEQAAKKPRICYIKRKAEDASRLKRVLECRNPRWGSEIEWLALDDLSVTDYAGIVRSSRIFLNLSPREGLLQSAFEAMRAGTLVAGYDGIGAQGMVTGTGRGRNGVFVQCGDFISLAREMEPLLETMLSGDFRGWQPILDNAKAFVAPYTPEAEETSLIDFWKKVLETDPSDIESSAVLAQSAEA